MSVVRKIAVRAGISLAVLAIGGLTFTIFLFTYSWETPESATGKAVPEPPPVPVSPWTTLSLEPTGIRPGPDDHSLLVSVSLPGKDPGCAREPHVEQVVEENNIIYANVVYSGKSGLSSCTETVPAEVLLTTKAPIADRTVSLNSGTNDTWGKLPTGWGRCDARLGCHPPADHCDPVWIAQVVFYADIAPLNRQSGASTTRGCGSDRLILDLKRNTGDCPPADGVPACTTRGTVNRVIYRWAGNGWDSYANAKTAGCAEILAVEPSFPTALCEKLPAP